jgi:hypothetical protein
MKTIQTFNSKEPTRALCDAVIGIHKAQIATMTRLNSACRTSSGQPVKELLQLIEETKVSKKKIEALRRQLGHGPPQFFPPAV